MGAWDRLVAKEEPFDMCDDKLQPRSLWTEAASYHSSKNHYKGEEDWSWWSRNVGATMKDEPGCAPSMLYRAVIPLMVARTSEAVSERAYSVISHVIDGRFKLSNKKIDDLTHIYWAYSAMWQYVRNSKCLKMLS